MRIEFAKAQDGDALAELRVLAMQESLEELGRFDRNRARQRFLEKFNPKATRKVFIADELVGFYVVTEFPIYLFIDHLYVIPKHQGKKLGSEILCKIITAGWQAEKSIKLGALKGSRSNRFYQLHGFIRKPAGKDRIYAY